MSPAETLHHIRAVMDGGDTPHLALWKINRILEGHQPEPEIRQWWEDAEPVAENLVRIPLPSIDPDDNSWTEALRT